MSSKVMAPLGRRAGFPPAWTSVLAVIAHPDDVSSGLGVILDAFMVAGATMEVLCLTHGQVWSLDEAPGDLAILRGAELPSADDVLGPISTKLLDQAARNLGELSQTTRLAAEVVATADSCHPDGLLVFDASPGTDHLAATSAALLAAGTLGLPVLGWTLSDTVAAQLSPAQDAGANGDNDGEVDLRVTFDRARRRLGARADSARPMPGSVQWRRLELLADTGSLRWLRPPGGGVGQPPAEQARRRRIEIVDLPPTQRGLD